ncbi:hypothetical protein Dsin_022584 [Dipteronia sinensis]|uniref:Uncharacterized protein n=1 Tax=Dipteronia sinensis TaxID=43782 RepID=A0AAE0A2S4_9ROSI|nr:hypothetical protein Dsin_022584 [Dipteronia sinensis]
MESSSGTHTHSHAQFKRKLGNEERKKAAAERANNSSYATRSHRLQLLNKILQLISLQITASQEEELELLFAGLSG